MNLNKIVHQFLQSIPEIKGKKIAVGYSAGADSTALLHIMRQKQKHFDFELEAVFFIHGGSPINEGEDKNLLLAKEMCLGMGIPLIDIELDLVKKPKKSWEQLGRQGRLDFYKKTDYDFVFLGHHQDDQNETTMMQIMRGGGRGVSAMKPIEGIFCRPLLEVPKEEIYNYLKEKDIPWIEDPTNSNVDFTRNFWRKIALPTIQSHYPNQKIGQLLHNFRVKNTNLNQIAYDMSIVDGLENLLEGKTISVKNIPDYRIQNLLSFSFSAIGNSLENNKIENLIKTGKTTKKSEITIGDFNLYYDGENITLAKMEKNIGLKNKF